MKKTKYSKFGFLTLLIIFSTSLSLSYGDSAGNLPNPDLPCQEQWIQVGDPPQIPEDEPQPPPPNYDLPNPRTLGDLIFPCGQLFELRNPTDGGSKYTPWQHEDEGYNWHEFPPDSNGNCTVTPPMVSECNNYALDKGYDYKNANCNSLKTQCLAEIPLEPIYPMIECGSCPISGNQCEKTEINNVAFCNLESSFGSVQVQKKTDSCGDNTLSCKYRCHGFYRLDYSCYKNFRCHWCPETLPPDYPNSSF